MKYRYFWLRFFFIYQKSLRLPFKTSFWVQNHLVICVLALWIHNGYFVVKKLEWNVCIKACWYTNIFYWRITTKWTIILDYWRKIYTLLHYISCDFMRLRFVIHLRKFIFKVTYWKHIYIHCFYLFINFISFIHLKIVNCFML